MTISAIRLKNFKRFLQAELPMRPLTVLTGLNGGGKTSIIHALLLARQASSGSPPPDFVQLNGPFGLELGEVQDVLHLDADPDEGILVEVDDHAGTKHSWKFRTSDERSLNLQVLDRPHTPPAALTGEARRFSYLSAERLGPRDTLGASSVAFDDLQVGHRGEFTAQVLAVLERFRVSAKRLNPKTHELGGATTLRQQVEWWLSDIARPIALDAEWVPGSGVTLIRYRTPGHPVERRRPTNMGFGVTYALPVITAALMAPRDSLLLVENPEAHLHPSGQSAIGAFLSMIASDGVQVIVETHSDHIINGIRRAIATDRALAPEESTIQFFESNRSDVPGIHSIDILARGDLSDWPSGFFDQMDTDLAALAKVRRAGK